MIYDPVGGDTFDRSTKCIAFEGRILVIGFTGGRFADARTNHLLIKNYSVVGVHWGLYNVLRPSFVHATHDALDGAPRRGPDRPARLARDRDGRRARVAREPRDAWHLGQDRRPLVTGVQS